MANPMKYIKSLEAVGFDRDQAEAQVQMVLDAVEGNLATKSDFLVFQERFEGALTQKNNRFENLLMQSEQRLERRIELIEQRVDSQFAQMELRILTRLGFLFVSTTTIAVAVLTWLIKL